jgi:hypothetical protein
MIAAFMCAAIFMFFYCVVGAIRMGTQAGRHKWHESRHVHAKGCESCWMSLSDEERSARFQVNIDRSREKERIRYARQQAELGAKYPTHPSR